MFTLQLRILYCSGLQLAQTTFAYNTQQLNLSQLSLNSSFQYTPHGQKRPDIQTLLLQTPRHRSASQIMVNYKLFIQKSGAPGAGKSTIARLLAGMIDAEVVDHGLIKTKILHDGTSFAEATKHAYSLQWAAAEDIMRRGWSVIVDSTCNFRETLDGGTALAEKYGCVYRYVECRVDDIELVDERLHQRAPMRSQGEVSTSLPSMLLAPVKVVEHSICSVSTGRTSHPTLVKFQSYSLWNDY